MSIIITQNPSAATRLVKRQARRLFQHPLVGDADDLARLLGELPVRHKADLMNYGAAHRDDVLETAILFSETSGTTGSPLQTPRGVRDLSWNVLNQVIAYKETLQPGGDRVAILHPGVLSPFVEASAMALKTLGIGYVRLFPIPNVCEYDRIYEVLERYAITAIMSTPTLIYKLLYELKRRPVGALPSMLKKALVTGERFVTANARNLERILGPGSTAQPFVYGSSETATLMCGRRDCGYRPFAEDFVFEISLGEGTSPIVNPILADRAPRGPLIVSWLRDGLLPILRYHTGDYFTLRQEASGGEYIFVFDGRNDSSDIDIDMQHRIEGALFGLSFPIFHFECRLDSRQPLLRVDIVSSEEGQEAQNEAADTVREAVHHRWPIQVAFNRETLKFFEFSPHPKTRRFAP